MQLPLSYCYIAKYFIALFCVLCPQGRPGRDGIDGMNGTQGIPGVPGSKGVPVSSHRKNYASTIIGCEGIPRIITADLCLVELMLVKL